MMNIHRVQILKSCLRVIAGISDVEYQKRVWILGEGPEYDDFDETMCNFFQDGTGIIENYKEFNISDKQYQALIDFRNILDVCDKGPSFFKPEVIDSTEWKNIVQMAKEVLIAFNYNMQEFYQYKGFLTEEQARERIHKAGVSAFPRPVGIPENYQVALSDNRFGMRYVHPDGLDSVRVMPGNPNSFNLYQQKPYVIHISGATALDQKGNRVSVKSPEAHIPLEEFVYRPCDSLKDGRSGRVLHKEVGFIAKVMKNFSKFKHGSSHFEGVHFRQEKDNNFRSQMLNSLLGIIYDISDPQYQLKVWVEHLELLSDFEETICHFFDDFNAIAIRRDIEYRLTHLQEEKLLELSNSLREYSANNAGSPEIAILKDPDWHKIQKLAQEVLIVFNYQSASK